MLSTARKFVLVPANQWALLQQDASSTAAATSLDTFENSDKNIRESVQLYNQALQRHLTLKKQPQTPVPITIAKEPAIKEPIIDDRTLIINQPDELNPMHPIRNYVVPDLEAPPKKRKKILHDTDEYLKETKIPKSYHGKIKQLLTADIIDFNHKGELLFNDKVVPKSNAAKLLLTLVTKSKTFLERAHNLPGYQELQTELKDAPIIKAVRRRAGQRTLRWERLYNR